MTFTCVHCGKESDERDLILLRPNCSCFKMKSYGPEQETETLSEENDHGQEKAR